MRAPWLPWLVAPWVLGCGALIGIEDAVPIDTDPVTDSSATPETAPGDSTVGTDSRDAGIDSQLTIGFESETLPAAPAGVRWTGGPAVTGFFDGPQHVFAPASDGTVRHATHLGAGFGAWESIDGTIKGDIGAVMWSFDRIDVFGTDASSGRLTHSWFPYVGAPDGWPWPRKWEILGTGAIAAWVSVISRAPDTFDVFSERTPGGPARLTYYRKFADWTPVTDVSPLGTEFAIASESAASPEGYESTPYELAVRSSAGQLMVTRWTKAGFAPSTSLGEIAGRPAIALRRRAPEIEAPRDVYVAARDMDGGLKLWRRRDGAWQGSKVLASGAVGTPSLFSRSSAELVLVYLGKDEQLHWLSFE